MKKPMFAMFFFIFLFGCGSDESENIVDCFGQSLLVNVHHSVENGKTVNFNVSYNGEYTLKNSIVWDYGDGIKETVNGVTTSHTYSQSGTYTARASVSLTDPSCTFEVKEVVIVD